MTASVAVHLEVTEATLTCLLCGASGAVTRETGDVLDRIGEFAGQHLDPHIVAARFTANGLDVGWFTDWSACT